MDSEAGDVIAITAGVYQEDLVIAHSLEIRGANQGQKVTISGSIHVQGEGVRLILSHCSVQDSSDSGLVASLGSQAVVEDCWFSNHAQNGINLTPQRL
jgi:nitrous oxidase accessory protein NosD